MDKQLKLVRTLAAAAMTGLVAGAGAIIAGCQNQSPNPQPGVRTTAPSDSVGLARHDCKGQNACKGQGGCSSGDNGCAGKNSCKGKGGCSSSM